MYNFLTLLTLLFLLSFPLESKDLGIQGHTFPIEEENLKKVIQKRALQLSPKTLQTQSEKVIKNLIKEETLFQKLPHIQEATTRRSFFYDPTFMVEEDIFEANGSLLYERGTTIHPLKEITLDSGLLFFDGQNPTHIKWAERQIGAFKWILVSGNPIKLQEEKERPVFFDQGATYTKKFAIKQVPCRVTQAGQRLLIEELPIEEGVE